LQFHGGNLTDSDNVIPRNLTPEVLQALRAVRFIAQHIKDADKDNEVGTQAPQLGRLFLLPIFIDACPLGGWYMLFGGVLGVVIVYFAIFSASGGGLSPPLFFFIIVYCP